MVLDRDNQCRDPQQGQVISFMSAGEIIFICSLKFIRNHSAAILPSVSHKNSHLLLKSSLIPDR